MIRRPPRSTRTDTLFPYTTLFRSALCGGPGHRRRAVAVPLQSLDRACRLLPEAHRLRLEPRAERRSGDVPGGDRRSLEADQLQLPVFPGRSAGDPALAHRGGGDRRRGAAAPLLAHRLPAALADDRSAERRVGKEGVCKGRYRWTPYP